MLNEPGLFSIQLLPNTLRLNQQHRIVGQQPDNLCGPYWVSLLLQAYGVTDIDTSQLALLAGSVLPIGDSNHWLPPGANSRQDYSQVLPQTTNLQEAGTVASGLVKAVSQVSSRRYALIPLYTNWSSESVAMLIALCQNNPAWEAVPICNVKTGQLWGSRLALVDAIAYLSGEDILAPKADWDVGHFLTLAGTVEGDGRSLVLVRDTYPIFGWDGYHLQPLDAIASALRRDDGNEGGVLLFIAAKDQAEVERRAKEQGFAIAIWNNGTPT